MNIHLGGASYIRILGILCIGFVFVVQFFWFDDWPIAIQCVVFLLGIVMYVSASAYYAEIIPWDE
ncbi:MAG: hypothetical protein ACOYZ6_03235 [Chloroflexota bacterium]